MRLLLTFLPAIVTAMMPDSQCPSFPIINSPANVINLYFADIFNKLSPSSTDSFIRAVSVFQNEGDSGILLKFVFEIEQRSSGFKEYLGYLVNYAPSKASIPYRILKSVSSTELIDIKTVLDVGNLDVASDLGCSSLKDDFFAFLQLYNYFPSVKISSTSSAVHGSVKILFPPLVAPNMFFPPAAPEPSTTVSNTNFQTFLNKNTGIYDPLTQTFIQSSQYSKNQTTPIYNVYYSQNSAATVDNSALLSRLDSLEAKLLSRPTPVEKNNVVIYPYPVAQPVQEGNASILYNITQNQLSTNTTKRGVTNFGYNGYNGNSNNSGSNKITTTTTSSTQGLQVRPTEYLYNLKYGANAVPETMSSGNIYKGSTPGSTMNTVPSVGSGLVGGQTIRN